MFETPSITEHEHSPFLSPPIDFTPPEQRQDESAAHKAAVAAASSEAAERELAYLRALNPPRLPKLEPPTLKQPVLPQDFAEQAGALDKKIYQRGVAIDRDLLLLLGKERFAELLAKDAQARSLQCVLFTDLTSWPSVAHSFASMNALTATAVPRVKTAEAFAGGGEDKEQARKLEHWCDLWKAQQEPASVRNVLAFHDVFASLVFGQSMLEQLSPDNRLRSRFFVQGSAGKVPLFADWLSALQGAHYKVAIGDPLFSVLAWLSGDRTPVPDPLDLARYWSNARVPSEKQIQLAKSIWSGFLLDYRSWDLWNYVGRHSRQAIDMRCLEAWRAELGKRFPRIARFHEEMRARFWKSAGADYYQFDERAYFLFVDEQIDTFLTQVSALAAQAVEQTAKGACVGRFQDWLLCEGNKHKAVLPERVTEKLEAAFSGSTFHVTLGEVAA